MFVQLRLPSALPNIFSAARIAVGMALIGRRARRVLRRRVAAASATRSRSPRTADLTLQLWGSVFVLAFLGALAISLITVIERVVLHWHASQRA